MKQIVECVPNFSEGRDQTTIDAIADSIRNRSGVRLMGVEPDNDYNRSVVTFAGEPEAVLEAAFDATATAVRCIDMRLHKGEHPRLGAVDVVPFVPVANVTMDICIELAKRYGKMVADELGVPIYLYEAAATSPSRINLSDIRKGEYEGLELKLKDPTWKPDYGEALFNAQSGATVTGARKFLIAYNVNLATPDVGIAQEISLRIRESGRVVKDENGKPKKNEKGESIKIPGTLKAVKAMGVFLDRHKITQVSINLTDFETTPVHVAFEEVKKHAAELNVNVTGSEIVGLTPLRALLQAGEYYTARGDKKEFGEDSLVKLAIEQLGLSQLERFNPNKKIIEYQLKET
jgi:glutamate formiminotransferase/formiminotetrahydrofolate cyclodeaminase